MNYKSRITFFSVSLIALSMLCSDSVLAQGKAKRKFTRAAPKLLSVFEPIAMSASESTVKIQSGFRQIAVGTIIGEDGLILTKASEMSGEIKCKLPNGEIKFAKVKGIDVENDLALLKVDAEGLAVADLQPISPPTRGTWLAAPTDQIGSLAVGVVSVEERKIPPSRAFIGIEMEDVRNGGGVRITNVIENTPAKKVNLKAGDVIQKLDEFEIGNTSELRNAIGKYTPGSDIELTVERDEEEKVFRITLADAKVASPMQQRSKIQNSMGSNLSRRGTDFPLAFQHDMLLEAKQCGGPVVNLEGQIVGINVARSGRVANFAISVDVALSVIEKLKTGDYSPEKVNAERIEIVKEQLAELESRLKNNTESITESLESFDASNAKIEELERMKLEIANRIDEVKKQRSSFSRDKRILESKNFGVKEEIESVEKRLKALKAGTRPGF